jgi:hypothetical protein
MTAGPLPVASLPALPVGVCVLRIELKNKIKQLKVTEPSSVCAQMVCVECLIGKQKKPILFKVTVTLDKNLKMRRGQP